MPIRELNTYGLIRDQSRYECEAKLAEFVRTVGGMSCLILLKLGGDWAFQQMLSRVLFESDGAYMELTNLTELRSFTIWFDLQAIRDAESWMGVVLERVCHLLSHFVKLEHLDFGYSGVNREGIEFIVEGISKLDTLQRITFPFICGVEYGSHLVKMTNLKQLTISDPVWPDEVVELEQLQLVLPKCAVLYQEENYDNLGGRSNRL